MLGDEGELFERYHERLIRATAYRMRTSPENVEEACAFAWAALVRRDDVRRETVFAWLKEVARNEALRLANLDRQHVSLDTDPDAEDHDQISLVAGNSYVTPEALNEAMDRLRSLPEPLRRVVGLRAFGWKYSDIADELGVGAARVNNMLRRADDHLYRLRERELADRHPRTARLRDLEVDPPPYLRRAIGKPPSFNHRASGVPETLRDWRRLALAIEDHRDRHGVTDSRRALGPVGRTPAERAARDALQDRIDRFLNERQIARERLR